jgi:uncharacterized membrane protein YfcA
MFFETAGIEVAPWIPPLVAFVISFFTSTGGVSGAFLILPFQMSFLGFTAPSVSATNQLFNIVAIPSGVYRYIQEGRMVWPLTWIVVLGTLPGVLIGAIVRIQYLPDPANFKLFAALVLLYIGVKLFRDLVRPSATEDKASAERRFQELVQQYRRAQSERGDDPAELPAVRVTKFTARKISYEFYGERFDIPVWEISSVSFIVGIVGGIYGIGGGAIMAPFFVSIFRLPIYTIAGATLTGTFVTSVAGVIFYQVIAPYYPDRTVAPDWWLGLLFGMGGMAGMYLGARCQKYIPARAIKWMLVVVIVFTAMKYVTEFLGR